MARAGLHASLARAGASASAFASLAGCILSISPLPEGGEGADASDVDIAGDARDAPDASAADTAAVASVLPNGGFEDAIGGFCGPGWSGYNSKLERDGASVRSGTYSCSVCNTAGAQGDGYTLDSLNALSGVPFSVGEVWRAEGFVRRGPTNTTAATAHIAIRIMRADGGVIAANPDSPAVTLGNAWQKLEAEMRITQGGAYLNIFVYADFGNDGDCMVLDDLTLWRAR